MWKDFAGGIPQRFGIREMRGIRLSSEQARDGDIVSTCVGEYFLSRPAVRYVTHLITSGVEDVSARCIHMRDIVWMRWEHVGRTVTPR